jgi:hypothetical protein
LRFTPTAPSIELLPLPYVVAWSRPPAAAAAAGLLRGRLAGGMPAAGPRPAAAAPSAPPKRRMKKSILKVSSSLHKIETEQTLLYKQIKQTYIEHLDG